MSLEEKNRLIEALAAFFAKVPTPDDQALIEDWVGESQQNQNFFDRLSSGDVMEKNLEEYRKEDVRAAWYLMEKKMDRLEKKSSRRLSPWKYAAAVVALVSMVTLVYFLRPSSREEALLAQVEEPKPRGVQLILPDGVVIPIEEHRADTMNNLNGMMIHSDKKQMDYSLVADTVESFHTLKMHNGSEYLMILSDGSKVFLNAESEMRYPVKFLKDQRIIEFEGEAYFDIAHDAERPFIIRSGDLEVTVLGTEFNFRAYNDERSIETTLVQGKVRVSKGEQHCLITPGEQAIFQKETGEISSRKVDVSLYTAWRRAEIMFRDARLEDVMRNLSRWYGVKYEFLDNRMKDIEFGGCFDRYDNIEPILDMLRRTELVNVVKENNIVYISERK